MYPQQAKHMPVRDVQVSTHLPCPFHASPGQPYGTTRHIHTYCRMALNVAGESHRGRAQVGTQTAIDTKVPRSHHPVGMDGVRSKAALLGTLAPSRAYQACPNEPERHGTERLLAAGPWPPKACSHPVDQTWETTTRPGVARYPLEVGGLCPQSRVSGTLGNYDVALWRKARVLNRDSCSAASDTCFVCSCQWAVGITPSKG